MMLMAEKYRLINVIDQSRVVRVEYVLCNAQRQFKQVADAQNVDIF